MGNPKGIRQLLNTGKAKCNETFDALEYKNVCKTYVSRCVAQTRAGLDEFKICTKSGHCESITSFEQCVDTAVFLAGEFETWGAFGKIVVVDSAQEKTKSARRPRLEVVEPVPTKRKPKKSIAKLWADENTRSKVIEDIKWDLILDKDILRTYYALNDEATIVLVDYIQEGQNVFSPNNVDSGDLVAIYSNGKWSKAGRRDRDVISAWRKYGLPAMEDINIVALANYRKVLKKEIPKLKKLTAGKSSDKKAYVKSFMKIVETAKEVYPLHDDQGIVDERWGFNTRDFSWFVYDQLGKNGYLLPYYMGFYHSEKGESYKMDFAFGFAIKEAKRAGVELDSSRMIRYQRKGYGRRFMEDLKKLEEVLKWDFRKPAKKNQWHWFRDAVWRIAVIESTNAESVVDDSDLFKSDTVMFSEGKEDVTAGQFWKRVYAAKRNMCLKRAEELLHNANGEKYKIEKAKLEINKLFKKYRFTHVEEMKAALRALIEKYS